MLASEAPDFAVVMIPSSLTKVGCVMWAIKFVVMISMAPYSFMFGKAYPTILPFAMGAFNHVVNIQAKQKWGRENSYKSCDRSQ